MGKYDFSGWATRANLKCSDGRIIMPNAFKEDDGRTVPLVWNHNHNDPSDVIGHALLENRGDGVYAYCTFNDSENGKLGKILVEHGDVNALSICANKLKQVGSQVMHGVIREVSLVLAGANPGAFIENVMEHGEEIEDQAIIMTGEEISLYHAEEENEEMNSSTENNNNKTIKDVFDEMTEEQQKVVYAIVGQAVEDASDTSEDDEEDDRRQQHKHHRLLRVGRRDHLACRRDHRRLREPSESAQRMASDLHPFGHLAGGRLRLHHLCRGAGRHRQEPL